MRLKISHIVKSKSFESDGRVQKWVRSCYLLGWDVNVFFLEDKNIHSNEYSCNISIFKINLFFRKYFPQRKGYFFKILEYCFKVMKYLRKDNDIVVFHDVQQYLNLFVFLVWRKFFRKKVIIVWDLHELPHNFLFKFFITKFYLKFLLENVDFVIFTNKSRREFMKSKLNFSEKAFNYLNNYPDRTFNNKPKTEFPKELEGLRANLPYVIWLGSCTKSRNFDVFLEGFKYVQKDLNLVILGAVDVFFDVEIDKLKNQGIVYQDFVKQESMINFIDNALFTVILYSTITPNNLYCEPNRLYQSINRKLPVIVGSNPTMSKLVRNNNLGYVLSDDGTSIEEMKKCLLQMLKEWDSFDFGYFLENNDLSWESQISVILDSFIKVD